MLARSAATDWRARLALRPQVGSGGGHWGAPWGPEERPSPYLGRRDTRDAAPAPGAPGNAGYKWIFTRIPIRRLLSVRGRISGRWSMMVDGWVGEIRCRFCVLGAIWWGLWLGGSCFGAVCTFVWSWWLGIFVMLRWFECVVVWKFLGFHYYW